MSRHDDTSGPADELGLDAVMASCRDAHRRLLRTLEGLTDEMARRPSRLPGWTVGHVLTHLARNADSHVHMLTGAMRGQVLEQYPGGYEQRAADIDDGAGRPAAQLRTDVGETAERLEDTWAAMTTAAWDGHGLARGRPWPCREMPGHRWREVEVHHADLGLAYRFTDWAEQYTAWELPRAVATLPSRVVDPLERRRLLAWLLGRADDPGPIRLQEWQSRQDHYFNQGGGDPA